MFLSIDKQDNKEREKGKLFMPQAAGISQIIIKICTQSLNNTKSKQPLIKKKTITICSYHF